MCVCVVVRGRSLITENKVSADVPASPLVKNKISLQSSMSPKIQGFRVVNPRSPFLCLLDFMVQWGRVNFGVGRQVKEMDKMSFSVIRSQSTKTRIRMISLAEGNPIRALLDRFFLK